MTTLQPEVHRATRRQGNKRQALIRVRRREIAISSEEFKTGLFFWEKFGKMRKMIFFLPAAGSHVSPQLREGSVQLQDAWETDGKLPSASVAEKSQILRKKNKTGFFWKSFENCD